MSEEVTCAECKHREHDSFFHELWCEVKGKEVEPEDSCEKGEKE